MADQLHQRFTLNINEDNNNVVYKQTAMIKISEKVL